LEQNTCSKIEIRPLDRDVAVCACVTGTVWLRFEPLVNHDTFMNPEQKADTPMMNDPKPETQVVDEVTRVKLFLGIQAFFLLVSVFTGGFQFKLWSMLDTALMIQSIGVTGLVLVLEEARLRRLAFKVAIVLYLFAVFDMGINVLISGVIGWKS
jgi:hypothetical protein